MTISAPPTGVLKYLKYMNITSFFKAVAAEWTHIKWPTQREVVLYVVVVIIVSFIIAYYLGLLDIVFGKLLALIIS